MDSRVAVERSVIRCHGLPENRLHVSNDENKLARESTNVIKQFGRAVTQPTIK